MITANENYNKLNASYLFADIAKRVQLYQESNPDKEVIRLGIGDVTLPLPLLLFKPLKELWMKCPKTRHSEGMGRSRDIFF